MRTPCGGFEPVSVEPLLYLYGQARRPREGVAEQVTRQEAGDAPPPQQTQPLPQDSHSGIALPPPPPQSAEVQTQVVPSQARQQQGSVQTTSRIATSYASTSTGTMAKSGSQRKWVTWREIVLCYLVCRSSRASHSPECSSSSSSSRHLCSSVSRPEVLVGREALDRVAVLDRAGNARGLKSLTSTSVDVEIFKGDIDDMVDGRVGATPSRRLVCGCPPLVSQDAECDSVLCVLLVVVLSRSPWSPFSTARVKRGSSSTPVPGESSHSGVGAP
ncbi:hypothetical protein Taro_044182 [Colocasia esculenta]|uniref:Uncharacterized protein n=1 Tax=Colocasia esculenta TaxID=4460 RepID=A0A843X272_COLES|nr:hypothetical protein [Colocasia esculenta]